MYIDQIMRKIICLVVFVLFFHANIANAGSEGSEEIKSSNPEIIDSINNTGKLEEETEKKLKSVIEDFKKKKK